MLIDLLNQWQWESIKNVYQLYSSPYGTTKGNKAKKQKKDIKYPFFNFR